MSEAKAGLLAGECASVAEPTALSATSYSVALRCVVCGHGTVYGVSARVGAASLLNLFASRSTESMLVAQNEPWFAAALVR